MATPGCWNQRPEPLLEAGERKVVASRAYNRKWATCYSLLAFVACLIPANSSVLDLLIGLWTSLAGSWSGLLHWAVHNSLVGVGYIAALWFGLLALQQWTVWLAALVFDRKRPWEKDATPRVKQLLGLIRGPLPPPLAAATAAAAKPPPSSTPIGPPLRNVKPFASPATPKAILVDASRGPVPDSGGRSPFSGGKIISTPEQAKPFLAMFDTDAAPQQSPDAGFRGFGASPSFFGGSRVSPSALPGSTGNIVTYRPSLVKSGGSGSPMRAGDGRMAPSSKDTLDGALTMLHIPSTAALNSGTERLREWLASHVLQPLAASLASAHKDVENSLAQLGWGSIRIADLTAGNGGDDTGAARRPGGAGGTDDDVLVAQLREQLTGSVPPRAPASAQTPVLQSCVEAVKRYQRLAALVKGEHPRALLPPAPRGYVVRRLGALAQGSCVAAYKWNAGGAWAGKPWSPDLPSDSALVFYVFAAFLEMPSWQLHLEDAAMSPAAPCPLYLGTIPARPAETYAALLAMRPPAAHKGAVAVLGLGLASTEPHFTLVIGGEPAVTLAMYNALFQALYMFLQYVKNEMGACVGGRSLSYLHLEDVLKAEEPRPRLRWQSLFSFKGGS